MEFEFDENKSRSNKLKHGVDFVEAQTLWQDDDRIEVPARTADEPRLVIVGKIGTKDVGSGCNLPRGYGSHNLC